MAAAVTRAALASLVALALAGCGGGADAASGPYPRPRYRLLSETGLYADPSSHSPAAEVRPFEPAYALWSDAADKSRWIALPPGSAIDSSDMDRWLMPIGTRVWKEFSLDGERLETRLIERYGAGRDDFWMGAFVWNAEETDAELVELGQSDVRGTAHDAPAQDDCGSCHDGEPGRVLGFSALQLSHPARDEAEWTLTSLADEARLSLAPEPAYTPPGDAVTARALGYLHANCGHCHNSRGTSWPDTQMLLRLNVGETLPEETGLYRSIVGEALDYYRDTTLTTRVVAGAPEQSAVIERMNVRAPMQQMPPLATEAVDATGVERVSEWIRSLPADDRD
jgi:hypothetical protein